MKQLFPPAFVFAVLTSFASAVPTAPLVIDDFEAYAQTGYVQDQLWSLWRRFGTATADGIYSIPKGAKGRGGSYAVNWSLGNAGYLRYSFPAVKRFALGAEFAVDLQVSAALPGTQVHMLIADGDPNKPGTTTYKTTAGLPLTDTDYKTYRFTFSYDTVRRTSGGAALDEVLAHLASLTLVFGNSSGAGSQNINLDNLVATSTGTP